MKAVSKPEDLSRAPRILRTPRTVLKAPHLDQVPVRMAWAAANADALHFVAWWRLSAEEARATRSVHSEIASMELGTELIYNVFACAPDQDPEAAYACGPYVGRIDLHTWDFDAPRCEIGYMADVRTQGQGLLREAASAAVSLAFALGVQRVHAITDVDNAPSIRFAQAISMQIEGRLRAWERDEKGELRDQCVLSVTAADVASSYS